MSTPVSQSQAPSPAAGGFRLSAAKENMLACPACSQDLSDGGDRLQCRSCDGDYRLENGIPLFFRPESENKRSKVTKVVRDFYENIPFPNYDDTDSRWSLADKAKKGMFARQLDKGIPPTASVLEVGCGTGQLTNFLALKEGRKVFGADLSLSSLKLAKSFRDRNGIENAAFLQMDLFRPAFRPESFDFSIAQGVLHHTADPELAFRTVAKLVKVGGYIIVGLYNRWGRILTDIRRFLFRLGGSRLAFLDPRLRKEELNPARRTAWFADQYQHPWETKHTFGSVLSWFSRYGFDFVNSIPKLTVGDTFGPDEDLFSVRDPGTALDHFLVQTGMIFSGSREGGFFVMIGRKKRIISDEKPQQGRVR